MLQTLPDFSKDDYKYIQNDTDTNLIYQEPWIGQTSKILNNHAKRVQEEMDGYTSSLMKNKVISSWGTRI